LTGARYIAPLTVLVSSEQKDQPGIALSQEIKTVSGAIVYTHFIYLAAYGSYVTQQSHFRVVNSSVNAIDRILVAQPADPPSERGILDNLI
jgi:hypothetical protein